MSDQNAERARGSVGRPTIENVRDKFITVRVTTIEKIRFLEKAQRSGVDPTTYARARILRGIARRKKAGADAREHELAPLLETAREVWNELRRIGVNLNQLAHHCNRHEVPPPGEFHLAVRELLALLRQFGRS